ncbi:MAG: acetyl-CoA hydrolase/transferase family protein [Saprospiraceae bacterium]|nr:acetyl-CoA hydrolase/transferase family protein [Saprospiraceae bacterium]
MQPRVFVHGSAATPLHLARALAKRAHELRNVELVSVSTLGEVAYTQKAFDGSFFINSLFVSESVRSAVNAGHGDYIPIFLSEIPSLFRAPDFKLDVALIHVSTPDKHGYCSLGVSVDVAKAAVQEAKYIIAQVNAQMPRTHGDGLIHISKIHSLVEVNEPLPEANYNNSSEVNKTIGQYCADLIEDGATLQMGIGEIPNAVLSCLSNHKNLGVHTEMFSNGVLPLVEKGVINNTLKTLNRGKLVAGFVIGSRALYDFVDDNPEVVLLDISYVNDPAVIKRNPKVVAINSAIEIDLTGQVCADSIGTIQYSGVGGQMDFLRGAALSPGGKPIIALPSTTSKGISKITPFLKQGAGVVTTRAHVHYVVTEYGVAYLFGKNLRQRAAALINISHPNHREMLEKAAHERFGGL